MFDGKILEPDDWKKFKKYRNVYRVEKISSELTKEEEEEWYDVVREAKRSELVGIMKHDAMRCVKKLSCSTKSISSRWVLTWKMINGDLGVKTRLVIKGFLDPQVNQIITASATASALSHRMLASYAVNHALKVVSYDVSQAFLQGLLLKDLEKRGEMKREVFFDPQPDAWGILYESLPEQFSMLDEVWSTDEVTLQAVKVFTV